MIKTVDLYWHHSLFILGEGSDDENIVSADSDFKYEKIGDYKVKDYVKRPHEYKK